MDDNRSKTRRSVGRSCARSSKSAEKKRGAHTASTVCFRGRIPASRAASCASAAFGSAISVQSALERVFQSCFRALQSTSIEIPCFPERSILSRFILPPSAAVNAIFAENGHSKGDTSHTSAPLFRRQSTRIRAELNPSGRIAAPLASAHFFPARAARS